VAVGFASKTSLSNIISGFFLIGENAFTIGDLIEAGPHRGYVMSIDLLSVKLRTTDNRMVRVPNESLLQDCVTNVTRFPIRRMEFSIGVAYREDLRRVTKLLMQVAAENEWVLDEPEPAVQMINFADSACEFWVAVWFERDNWSKVRETFLTEVKECFDRNDIEIPFPHRTIYTGSCTDPMPLTLVSTDGNSADGTIDGK
jgi:small-conductance mechanosensitive channel